MNNNVKKARAKQIKNTKKNIINDNDDINENLPIEEIRYKTLPCGQIQRLCPIDNCTNLTRKHGMCNKHLNIKNNTCTSRNCKEVALTDGSKKCVNHRGNENLDVVVGTRYKTLPSGYKQRLCMVNTCEKSARKGGMCAKHTNVNVCSLDTCAKLSANGIDLCEEHSLTHSKCDKCEKVYPELFDKHCSDCIKSVAEQYKADELNKHKVVNGKIVDNRKIESAIYYEKNKEEMSKKAKIYRENNPEKAKQRMTNWRTKNPFKILINSCRNRDNVMNRGCDITEDHINELLIRQANKCYYCKHVLDMELGEAKLSQLSVDRVDNNLGHLIGNCVVSCLFCNFCRNDTDEQHYIDFLFVLKAGFISEAMQTKYDKFDEQPNLIRHIRTHCYISDKKKSGNYNIMSSKEIREMMENQNNCCAITGIKFINAHIYKFCFKMSLDRIDNSKLHTKDNCQLVCMAIQFGRSNKSVEEVKRYIEEIKLCC